ncbi:hypothetical protein FACS1894202_12980 [Clostridia bacterium]|nr:hypothetical protein FACS1894202_12980 [Clostridia bacterium]
MRIIIGAVLLIAGAMFCGGSAARRLSERTKVLTSLTSAIGFIRAEITFGYTPLPIVCEKLTGAYGELRALFEPCAGDITSDLGFEPRWQSAINAANFPLKTDERETLRELGGVLGRYDAESQRAALERAESRFAAFADLARLEQREKSRLYGFMGAAAGIALTILIV